MFENSLCWHFGGEHARFAGVALLLLVTAELANSRSGLGYLIWQSWQTFQIEEMYIGLVTISLIGYLSFQLLDLLEHVLIPWKPRKE